MKIFTLLQTPVGDVTDQVVAVEETPQAAEVQTVTEIQDPAGAEAPAAKPAAGNSWSMWVMLALIFVVMYFFMIRPQKKQQKELQNFRDALKKGDKVVTIGGIYGTVTEIKENTVLIEVDNGVKIRVSKQALVKDFSEPQQ